MAKERATKINFNQYATVDDRLKDTSELVSEGILSNRGTTKPSMGHSKKLSIAAKHRRVTSLDMKSIADHQAQNQAYQDDPRYKEYLSLH